MKLFESTLCQICKTLEGIMPTVSVVVPTYNRAHLLHRSIQSILNQTYQDFEIVIIDDGSTDNTENVVNYFNDKRIRYIKHEKNKGASVARNSGIIATSGDFIAFLDDDDEWFPQKLEKQIKKLLNSPQNMGAVYTNWWNISENGSKSIAIHKKREGYVYWKVLEISFVGFPVVLIKKECFEKCGLIDERLPNNCEDWEFLIRVSKYYHFSYINEPLMNRHITPGSLCSNINTNAPALKYILNKHFNDIKKSKRLLARYQYMIGNALWNVGDCKNGRKYLLKAIKIFPINIKYFLIYFFSNIGPRTYKKAVNILDQIYILR